MLDQTNSIEPRIVAFIRAEIDRDGVDGSGMFNYYEGLSRNGHGFVGYDKPIAAFIESNLTERYSRYLEVGAGLAQLIALLGSKGMRGFGVESEPRRYAAMVRLFKHLGLDHTCSGVEGLFPIAGGELLAPDMLVICTNIVTKHHGIEESILSALERSGGMIIDLSRFTKYRETTVEQDELAERIVKRGFAPPVPVYANKYNRIVYFARR